MPPYPVSQLQPSGGSVNLLYGDSQTGTHASGPVGQDTVTIADLTLSAQTFSAISDTNNTSVMNGADGILGAGFPSARSVLLCLRRCARGFLTGRGLQLYTGGGRG